MQRLWEPEQIEPNYQEIEDIEVEEEDWDE
jgi:hypothetical protein